MTIFVLSPVISFAYYDVNCLILFSNSSIVSVWFIPVVSIISSFVNFFIVLLVVLVVLLLVVLLVLIVVLVVQGL